MSVTHGHHVDIPGAAVKLVRALLAVAVALTIGVGVQAVTSTGASAACGTCWWIHGDD